MTIVTQKTLKNTLAVISRRITLDDLTFTFFLLREEVEKLEK